jgi:signal transduction histidine kinase
MTEPRRRSRPSLPLAAWVGGGAALGSGLVVGGIWAQLRFANELTPGTQGALGIGLLIALMVSATAAVVADRFAAAVRAMRDDAVRRLQDPDAPVGAVLPGRSSGELRELARTLDALHLRVRVADEVAGRHRKTAENASAGMFELLSGLVAAEEGARGQLSAELHDTVAQSLMRARSMLDDPTVDPERARHIADLVGEAEEQVRAVMARTRPPALRDGDLARAVGALRDDMELRYGLRVAVRWPSSAYPLPLVTAITVYRFFQEALLNVIKHADVDEASVALVVDADGVVATVHDAGPGFDPEQVKSERGRHVGLGLLRERARLAGGSLVVSSWPGDGTTLTLRLPRGAAGVPVEAPVQRLPMQQQVSAS